MSSLQPSGRIVMRDGDIAQFLAKVESARLDPSEIYAFSCMMDSHDVWASIFQGGGRIPLPSNPIPPFQVIKGANPMPFDGREHVTLPEYAQIVRGEIPLPHRIISCSECEDLYQGLTNNKSLRPVFDSRTIRFVPVCAQNS